MDLQNLNKLERVLQHLVPSENSDTAHWLRCVDAYCGNIVQGLYFFTSLYEARMILVGLLHAVVAVCFQSSVVLILL